ncbi:MAG: hypothetical protein ACRD07_17375 [Acidimicrobiales bacterium]
MDPIIDELFRAARRQGRREARDAYAFDALIELARRARGGARPPNGGDRPPPPPANVEDRPPPPGAATTSPQIPTAAATATTSPQVPTAAATATAPARPKTANPAFLSLLRVDLEALLRGRTERDETCDIAGVGPVPARVARTLLGDAILKLVITKGVDVVNVTHLGRGPTAAQRVAMLWTSPACTNSLCSHTLQIQHDHRQPWIAVHETRLDNLDRLCDPCHKRKTHHGWALVAGKGRRPLVPPDHPHHPSNHSAAPDDKGPPSRTRDHKARAPTLFGSDAA